MRFVYLTIGAVAGLVLGLGLGYLIGLKTATPTVAAPRIASDQNAPIRRQETRSLYKLTGDRGEGAGWSFFSEYSPVVGEIRTLMVMDYAVTEKIIFIFKDEANGGIKCYFKTALNFKRFTLRIGSGSPINPRLDYKGNLEWIVDRETTDRLLEGLSGEKDIHVLIGSEATPLSTTTKAPGASAHIQKITAP